MPGWDVLISPLSWIFLCTFRGYLYMKWCYSDCSYRLEYGVESSPLITLQGVSVNVQTNGFLLCVQLPHCMTPGQGLRLQNSVSTLAKLWNVHVFTEIYHNVAKLLSALLLTVCFVFVYLEVKKHGGRNSVFGRRAGGLWVYLGRDNTILIWRCLVDLKKYLLTSPDLNVGTKRQTQSSPCRLQST